MDAAFDTARHELGKSLSVALSLRDRMTQLHSERVGALAMMIAAGCSLQAHERVTLGLAAAFHDIGKIGIPDHILMKPGPLDETEWRTMTQHAEYGERIIRSTGSDAAEHAASAIRHHHEHFDGGGYPDGLAGARIPLCSRIIAVADSYDAMAVTRSYHRARAHDEIMAVMQRETGSKLDPEIMGVFRDEIERSPLRVS